VKLSARNQLKGKIIEVKKDATTTHVRMDIDGQTITASVTNESAASVIRLAARPVGAIGARCLISARPELRVTFTSCRRTIQHIPSAASST
jgi:molybdopterin-binding protein